MKIKAIGKREGIQTVHGYTYGQKFLCGKPVTGFTVEKATSDTQVTCPDCKRQMLVLGDLS